MRVLIVSVVVLGLIMVITAPVLAQTPAHWEAVSPWDEVCDNTLRNQTTVMGFAFNPVIPNSASPFKEENWFPMEWTDQGCSWNLIPGYGSDLDQSGNLYRPPTSYFDDVTSYGVTEVTFGFYARSDTPASLIVELAYADENYLIRAIFETVNVTDDWQFFEFDNTNIDLWANGEKRIMGFYPTFDVGAAWPNEVQVDYLHVEGYVPAVAPTRTPVATRTPTATATARPSLWATPTPAPSVSATVTPLATKQFPASYSHVPTSIPVLRLPPWPPIPPMPPISTPATPLALALLPTPNFPDVSQLPVGTGTPTPTPLAWTTNVVSLTAWLSSNTNLTNTDTFTLVTAPGWYAENLPRPLANVGWTFEQMSGGIDSSQRYTIASWAALAGYVAALPIQLAKSVRELFQFLGPFGYFITWLLVLLPGVLFFKWIEFIKNLIIRLFNFVLDLIRFILELIKLLPFV